MVAWRGLLYRGGMSVILEPRGPEPPTIYWLRRAAVVLVVVTLIAGLWWFFIGRSGETQTIQTAAETQLTVDEDIEAAALVATEPQECAEDDIRVRARMDKKSMPAGSKPKVTLVIRNVGEVPCLREVGPRANELAITSGGYSVWTSKHCNTSKKSNVLLLEPGQRAATTIRWNGRLSKKGCPEKTAAAKPGSYELVGRNGNVTSKKARFSLVNPG
jgi:hypothetical protein